ncbi:hypothetical protein SLEP1_g40793 [Rubroshorea leprosula]|uniref:Uncharacterized protein n=1 Tax=Rubroshorea leprosula TaxID=152421 RepID=A0AAV5L4I9_9ROSI|nr:hypothetical protein SLEP1_g40793 [Rubroshorea leprosula]
MQCSKQVIFADLGLREDKKKPFSCHNSAGESAVIVNGDDKKILVKTVKGKVCTQGWEYSWWSQYCCNQT